MGLFVAIVENLLGEMFSRSLESLILATNGELGGPSLSLSVDDRVVYLVTSNSSLRNCWEGVLELRSDSTAGVNGDDIPIVCDT